MKKSRTILFGNPKEYDFRIDFSVARAMQFARRTQNKISVQFTELLTGFASESRHIKTEMRIEHDKKFTTFQKTFYHNSK